MLLSIRGILFSLFSYPISMSVSSISNPLRQALLSSCVISSFSPQSAMPRNKEACRWYLSDTPLRSYPKSPKTPETLVDLENPNSPRELLLLFSATPFSIAFSYLQIYFFVVVVKESHNYQYHNSLYKHYLQTSFRYCCHSIYSF